MTPSMRPALLIRELRAVLSFDAVSRDAGLAFRQLVNAPGFTLAAILTLAIGIGVNTGVFTLLYSLAFRPLPLRDADRLVTVYQSFSGTFSRGINGNIHLLSYPEYESYRDRTAALQGLAAYAGVRAYVGGGETNAVSAALVSCNYFDVLSARTQAGRSFTRSECDTAGTARIAVLSHGFWQRQFGGDANAIGGTLVINRSTFTIVGVAEREFTGTDLRSPDLWVPISNVAVFDPNASLMAPNVSWLDVVGRLKPGATVTQARSDLARVAQQMDREAPGRRTAVTVDALSYLNNPEARFWGAVVAAGLIGVAMLVLAMSCGNVMTLLLARAAARRREMSIRVSLGAGQLRLIQQLMIESTALALASGVIALVLAFWVPRALMIAVNEPTSRVNTTPDLRVLGFMLVLSWLSALVFGLAPAILASRVDLSLVMKDETARLSGRVSATRLRELLVAGQVAGCVLLLVVGSLLLRGVRHAQAVDLGIATADVVAVSLDLAAQGYDPARAAAVYRDVRSRLDSVDGVRAVSVAASVPLLRRSQTQITTDAGSAAMGPATPVSFNAVSGNFFETMDVRLVAGRPFADDEMRPGTSVPVVISQSMAERLWPDGTALGGLFRDGERMHEVVGIAEDVRVSLTDTDAVFFYRPLGADITAGSLLIRAPGRVTAIAGAVAGLIRSVDPAVVPTVTDLRTEVASLTQPARAASTVSALAGFFGLLLAVVGLYGLLNYAVRLRRRELAIRLALGATPRELAALLVRQSMRPIVRGLVAGVFLALGASQAVKGMMFGANELDPVAFVLAIAFVGGVASGVMYAQARRATSIDPLTALRVD